MKPPQHQVGDVNEERKKGRRASFLEAHSHLDSSFTFPLLKEMTEELSLATQPSRKKSSNC